MLSKNIAKMTSPSKACIPYLFATTIFTLFLKRTITVRKMSSSSLRTELQLYKERIFI